MEENDISLSDIVSIIENDKRDELLNYPIIKTFITTIYNSYDEFNHDDDLKDKLIYQILYSTYNNMNFINANSNYILNYLKYMNEDAEFIISVITMNAFIQFNSDIKNTKLLCVVKNNIIPLPVVYPNESKIKRIFDIIFMSN